MNQHRCGEARLEVALAQVDCAASCVLRSCNLVLVLCDCDVCHTDQFNQCSVFFTQAIINEVKYGSETNQLAEVSLLAAFQNRAVGEKLTHALLLLMPGLQYFRQAIVEYLLKQPWWP